MASLDGARRPATLLPTVSCPALLESGRDSSFRTLVHHLLGFSHRLLAIRNGFAGLLGLSGGQYTVLTAVAHLQEAGAVDSKAVAEHLRLDAAFVAAEMERLGAACLLAPAANSSGFVRLSTRGAALLDQLAAFQVPVNDALFRTLTKERFDSLTEILRDLVLSAEEAHVLHSSLKGRMTLLPDRSASDPVSIDQQAFRYALGHFATGITVITAEAPGGRRVGMTMNSFNSVSLNPPLILFSVARSALSLSDLEAAASYAVNVLRHDQADVSTRFAKASSDKWGEVGVRRGRSGCLMLDRYLAVLECVPYATYDGGDHVIFVGRVAHFDLDPAAEPLLYFRGDYAALHSSAEERRATA